jgi:hypothetical protein
MKTMTLCLAIATIAILGCSGAAPTKSPSGGDPVDIGPGSDAPPVDHPPLGPEQRPITSGSPQRLSVAQLRGSLPVVLGQDDKGKDITWMIGAKPALDSMGKVLGEPDWDMVTTEDLTPSPLYLKFMDDAARDTCSRVLNADAIKTTGRTFIVKAALTDVDPAKAPGIDDNLRYLKLRFHAAKIDPSDSAAIAPLHDLFIAGAAASTSSKPQDQARSGWLGVCVALLTAPEFHLY